LEWTEIIVIFVPISAAVEALNIDRSFGGTLVFRQPAGGIPVAAGWMSAFYLKGVAPKHVTSPDIQWHDAPTCSSSSYHDHHVHLAGMTLLAAELPLRWLTLRFPVSRTAI